ncbi:uncharacterized protein CPUR_08529 [Claviceps purpurea 20.1]|uniref:Uncharacterized protein n=1 Tax=Claviceps purpurea (strain 20.1) TaxID=1111077 RepID=M1W6F2_CLAP2|nr:uncharacterized protein CPUR_08529 [Claviceps purpurea 20.1]
MIPPTAPPSKHSRAARRATSPSINTDKSLKSVAPPSRSSDTRPSVLEVHRSAGVTKKTRPARKARLSSKMRKRHEKGLEMAAAVTERTGKKLEKSIGRARVVVERSRAWEEEEEEEEKKEKKEKKTKTKKVTKEKKEVVAENYGVQVGGILGNGAVQAGAVVDEDEDEIL